MSQKTFWPAKERYKAWERWRRQVDEWYQTPEPDPKPEQKPDQENA